MSSESDRIIELERLAADQDRVIADLSEQIAEQWKAIDMLTGQLKRLAERFLTLEEQTAPDVPITRPPHW